MTGVVAIVAAVLAAQAAVFAFVAVVAVRRRPEPVAPTKPPRASAAVSATPPWARPIPFGDAALHVPAPATAAARASRFGAPDSPLLVGRAGSPEAIRELLSGIGDTLLMEGAHAAVRGDERNAGTLVWLADFTADARDAITDAD